MDDATEDGSSVASSMEILVINPPITVSSDKSILNDVTIPPPTESTPQGRGQGGSSSGTNGVYGDYHGDYLVSARLVGDDQEDDGSVGDPGNEVKADPIIIVTAKPIPPFIRFAQNHWVVLSILAMVILATLVSLGAVFGTHTRPKGGLTQFPTEAPTISAYPSSSFAPSPASSGAPSTPPTQPCDMSPKDWAARVMAVVGDAMPSSRLALIDPSAPQGRAMTWLTQIDSIFPRLCPGIDNNRLRQRFGLALLHEAMNGEGWKYASSEQGTQFLRGRHECNWAAVECDSYTNMVTHILLGTYAPIKDPLIGV